MAKKPLSRPLPPPQRPPRIPKNPEPSLPPASNPNAYRPLSSPSKGFARLRRTAIGPHVDPPPIRLRLIADRTARIARIDTGTRHIVENPASAGRVPPPRLRFQMIIPIDPEIVIQIIRRPVRIPIPRVSEERIDIEIPLAGPTTSYIAVAYANVRPIVISLYAACIPKDAVRQYRLVGVPAIVSACLVV